MKPSLFLLVIASLPFCAAVWTRAQAAADPAPGIDNNCAADPTAPQADTVLFFTRFGLFLQSSASQVTPDPRSIRAGSANGTNSAPFSASLMFFSGTNSATAPLLRCGALVYPLPDTGGNGSISNCAFATEAALAAVFPADSYSAQYSADDGSIISVSLALADFNLPTPTIANFDELQSSPVGQAFTVRWLPFGGANSTNSSITFRVEEIDDYGDPVKTVFLAPNHCTNIALLPTDAEMTVPAGILQPGSKYQGKLCFGRLAYARQAGGPPLLFETSDSKQTRFPLGGAVVPEPSIAVVSIAPAGDGKFTVTLNVTGAPSVIVDTSVDLVYWEFYALRSSGPAGVATFDFTPSASEGARFYRVRTYY